MAILNDPTPGNIILLDLIIISLSLVTILLRPIFLHAALTLKRLLLLHSVYPEALTLLAKVQEKINRSPNTVKVVRKKYERFDYVLVPQERKKILKREKSNLRKTVPSVSSTELKPLKVSPKLATFTLAEILENQGLYPQAIDILDMLEDKKEDKKQLKEYRDRIIKKFHSNN